VLLAFLACRGGERFAETPHIAFSRNVVETNWDTAVSIGGSRNDTLLSDPRLLAATSDLIVVYDRGVGDVAAFDRNGDSVWRFGRTGAGPGEFLSPSDLAASDDGAIWVVDPGNTRVTVLNRDGSQARLLPVAGDFILQDVLVLQTGVRLTLLSTNDTLWADVDSTGIIKMGGYPSKQLAEGDPYARQVLTASSPTGGTWGIITFQADQFYILSDSHAQCRGRLPEGTPLDKVDVRSGPIWAASAAMTDSTLLVLARTRDDDDLRILDEYDFECRYLRTLKLPIKSRGIAYAAGVIYLIHGEPIPGVLGIRGF
jgi:hypothetical protein